MSCDHRTSKAYEKIIGLTPQFDKDRIVVVEKNALSLALHITTVMDISRSLGSISSTGSSERKVHHIPSLTYILDN